MNEQDKQPSMSEQDLFQGCKESKPWKEQDLLEKKSQHEEYFESCGLPREIVN